MRLDKIWNIAKPNPAASRVLSKNLKISPITTQLLINRGITTVKQAQDFFLADLSSLGDPLKLPDIEAATKRIKKAVKNKEKICVFGDYDVDGITSVVLLTLALRQVGADVSYYIPCRFKEGYSLSKNALKQIKDEGNSLVVTVDCGVRSIEEVKYAKEIGLEVIITDHHEPGEILPSTLVVNPKRKDSPYSFRELAGVAVAYQVVKVLLGDEQKELLDLVCLGSIADLVPIVGENRSLVKEGLEVINSSSRLGLASLIKASGLGDSTISSGQIGYIIAPRLNAGGRVESAAKGAELLLTDDKDKACELADYLDKINRQRQKIEEEMIGEVFEQIEKEVDLERDKVIVLASDSFHDGVKGIVASRVVENYFRPTILCTLEKGKVKGSGRSIPAFHLHQALEQCADTLTKFGGHAHAVGVNLEEKNLVAFRKKLNQLATCQLSEEDLKPKLRVDGKVQLNDLSLQLFQEIKSLAPHGNGNPSPVFCAKEVYLKDLKWVGQQKKHLKFNLFRGPDSLSAIMFNSNQPREIEEVRLPVDIAFSLEQNVFGGKTTLQARVSDIKFKQLDLSDREQLVEHLFLNAGEIIKDDEYKHIGEAGSFYTKLAGVTFEGRQGVIQKVKNGTEIALIRQPDHETDRNAIRVDTTTRQNLGYLNARLARKLAPYLDNGASYQGRVTEVTGGGGKNYGVNVHFYKVKNELLPKSKSKLNKLNELKDQELFLEIKKILLGDLPLRKKQVEAIEALQKGQNCLTIMGTGRGKSAIFHLFSCYKAVSEKKITVILYPLRSLITDQHLYLKEVFEQAEINAIKLTGDIDMAEREEIFKDISEGLVSVILTTPEFLFHNKEQFAKFKKKIGFLVVDEAHHVCTSSQTHRPIYRQLDKLIPVLGNPLVLATTATASDKVAKAIRETLKITKLVIDPAVRENLSLVDKRRISNKEDYLKKLIERGEKTVIYVNSRKESVSLAECLRSVPGLGDRVVFYNAGMGAELRMAVQKGFMAGDFKVVVATSAFGEGVNIPDIANVVLYHLPFSFIEYNQQSGRAGRDGKSAFIHLLFGEKDASINEFILESNCPSRDSLIKVYRVLQLLLRGHEVITLSNEEILSEIEDRHGVVRLNSDAVAHGLKIFSELGLIEIEGRGSQREISMLMSKKVELEDSVAFEEGQHEKEQFADFKELILGAGADELLELVNQPIYPLDTLTESGLHRGSELVVKN